MRNNTTKSSTLISGDKQIPTLIFEVYDQPSKVPSDNTLGNSEQNYGVFHIYNTMKDPGNLDVLPNPKYVQKPQYDTSAASVFTFIGLEHRDSNNLITSFSPSEITITLTDPNGFTLTRTYKPFAMKTAANVEQMVWASVNLYQGSTAAYFFYQRLQSAYRLHQYGGVG